VWHWAVETAHPVGLQAQGMSPSHAALCLTQPRSGDSHWDPGTPLSPQPVQAFDEPKSRQLEPQSSCASGQRAVQGFLNRRPPGAVDLASENCAPTPM